MMFHFDIYHISLTGDNVQKTKYIYLKQIEVLFILWMLFRNTFF